MATPAPARIVTCPTCGGEAVYGPQNRYRPFCSERCRNVDFGAWATESYRVPTPPTSADAETDEPPGQ